MGDMRKGGLVTLEGLSATGKTTLMPIIAELLVAQGFSVMTVPEFSEQPTGDMIRSILSERPFVTLSEDYPSALSVSMLVVADLYFQDELVIRPALDRGQVVIKERHIDTIFAYEIPKNTEAYDCHHVRLYDFFSRVTARLTRPDATYLLSLPKEDHRARLIERRGELDESSWRFEERVERTYEDRMQKEPDRIVPISTAAEVDLTAKKIVNDFLGRYENR